MEKRIELEKRGRSHDQIQELNLDNCRSQTIVGLDDSFKNLEFLSMINVGLTSLKGFPNLPKLKRLELSDNRISNGLNHLKGCTSLQYLNLCGNKIKDIEALEPLKELKKLEILDLFTCEVTELEDYRKKVFEMLPNLKFLDGYDCNNKEIEDDDDDDDSGNDECGDEDDEDEDVDAVSDDNEDEEDADADEEAEVSDEEDEEDGEVGLSYLNNNNIDEEEENDDFNPEDGAMDEEDDDIDNDEEDAQADGDDDDADDEEDEEEDDKEEESANTSSKNLKEQGLKRKQPETDENGDENNDVN